MIQDFSLRHSPILPIVKNNRVHQLRTEREFCYQTTALPPNHHGWIRKDDLMSPHKVWIKIRRTEYQKLHNILIEKSQKVLTQCKN